MCRSPIWLATSICWKRACRCRLGHARIARCWAGITAERFISCTTACLATVGPTAVEQLIGRILRMPNACPTRVPALDRAYAFVLSDNVVRTAMQLRDRMVETCGFDERSAEEALRVAATQTQERLGLGRIPLSAAPAPGSLPPDLAQKTRYDEATKTLVLTDLLDRHEIQSLCESLTEPTDREAVETYWQRERPVGIAVKPLGQYAKPFRIPRLVVKQGNHRSLWSRKNLTRSPGTWINAM